MLQIRCYKEITMLVMHSFILETEAIKMLIMLFLFAELFLSTKKTAKGSV